MLVAQQLLLVTLNSLPRSFKFCLKIFYNFQQIDDDGDDDDDGNDNDDDKPNSETNKKEEENDDNDSREADDNSSKEVEEEEVNSETVGQQSSEPDVDEVITIFPSNQL